VTVALKNVLRRRLVRMLRKMTEVVRLVTVTGATLNAQLEIDRANSSVMELDAQLTQVQARSTDAKLSAMQARSTPEAA
jgi:hypothetical protein